MTLKKGDAVTVIGYPRDEEYLQDYVGLVATVVRHYAG